MRRIVTISLPLFEIAENLDDYLLEPDQRNPEEVAVEELRFIVDEHSRSILQKHCPLQLWQGCHGVKQRTADPYGLVQRRDGEPIRMKKCRQRMPEWR